MLNPKEINQLEHQAIVAALFRLCDPRRMENLKTGDTVQLKSGGPVMTIGGKLASGGWRCHWFSGSELKEGTFHLEELEKAGPRQSPEPEGSYGTQSY